jgi:biopolymer transport protein ExbB
MNLSSHFVDFAQLGANWVLWVLIGLSVLSVGVMIDRGMWFRGRDTDTDAFVRELRGAYDRGELDKLVTKYKGSLAVPVQVALRGIGERDHGPAAVAEAMHGERARWRRAADRHLIVLGTLGNNVPFIGLFGTVLGVINAFQHLSEKAANSEALTLATIAEALSATAMGLLVAIPAVIAFNYFSRRLKVVLGGADETAHAVLSLIYGSEHAGEKPPEADKAAKKPDKADKAEAAKAEKA